jgi:hypothetical protein
MTSSAQLSLNTNFKTIEHHNFYLTISFLDQYSKSISDYFLNALYKYVSPLLTYLTSTASMPNDRYSDMPF